MKNTKLKVRFMSGGRTATQPPNPKFPEGIRLDMAGSRVGCAVDVPYPAVCVGSWLVHCPVCDLTVLVTAAGRPDDPCWVRIPCKLERALEASQHIVGVAVRDQHGEVHTLPAAARHHNVLLAMDKRGLHCPDPSAQGFVLRDGTFVNRRAAYRIAKANGQLRPRPPGGYDGPELYSEDLW